MKTTNVDIIQDTKRDYQIGCKHCDWTINYLNTTYWKIERMMEMIAAMPHLPDACAHNYEIRELS